MEGYSKLKDEPHVPADTPLTYTTAKVNRDDKKSSCNGKLRGKYAVLIITAIWIVAAVAIGLAVWRIKKQKLTNAKFQDLDENPFRGQCGRRNPPSGAIIGGTSPPGKYPWQVRWWWFG